MIPTRVTFKGLTRRADIETVIQQEVASLAGHYHRIVDCRIRVEVPDRHQGAGNPVHVLIELTVPEIGSCSITSRSGTKARGAAAAAPN